MNKSKHHLAFFLPALNSGGAEKVFVTLANYYACKGQKIDFLLMKKTGNYLSKLSPNVRVIELGGKSMLMTLLPFINYCRSEEPEGVLCGLPGPNNMAIIGKLLMRTLGLKVPRIIISQRISFSAHLQQHPNLRNRLRYGLSKVLFKFADEITANSQESAKDLAQNCALPPERVHTIYNPLNINFIQNKAKEEIHHPWLINKDAPVIITVARLEAQKDYLTLLKALAQIPDIRLIAIGEGSDKDKLHGFVKEKGLEKRVDFIGYTNNPYAYVKKADLFVLSSLFEGLPNALMEALAVGTAIVSTDCKTGPREILEDGKYGRLVPLSNPAALKEAIEENLKQPVSTPAKRQKKAEEFNLDKIASAFFKLMIKPH